MPLRQTRAPSLDQRGVASVASVRVSWVSAPLRRSRTNTSPLRTKAMRARCGSSTGRAASMPASAAPSTTCACPAAMSMAWMSRIGLPVRLSG